MPPVTKSDTEKYLIGQPDSVIKPTFILAIQEGNQDTDQVPFSGPLQLPTTEEVLKLYFFFKNIAGKKNNWVSQNEIVSLVIKQVIKYWEMAGFKDSLLTITNIEAKVKKEVDKYGRQGNQEWPMGSGNGYNLGYWAL